MRKLARVVACVGGLAVLSAPEPPANDWLVTVQARRQLWGEPMFAELNLGVRVRDGAAVIWGPVLSEQQGAEAVARLKLVNGVRSVVSELYVLPADDLLRQRFQPPPPPSNKVIAYARPIADPNPAPPLVRPLPSSPIERIDEVRNRERRFRALAVSFANGVVTIGGKGDRPGDAMELAEKLRQLPGVTNVVLRD